MRLRTAPKDYQQQTHESPHWIVRWPHLRRIATAVTLMLEQAPHRILDYGAGDGFVIAEAINRGASPEQFVAYEPVPSYAEQIAERVPNVTLITDRDDLDGKFDCIACLGVLEHMPLPERAAFYHLCDSTLSPTGRLVIDVPVEVGPALAVKAWGRIALKARESEYTSMELFRYGLGGLFFDPARYDPTNRSTWIQNHQGFDFRLFERELNARFAIQQRIGTPIAQLSALLNQEVLYVAKPRGSREGSDPLQDLPVTHAI